MQNSLVDNQIVFWVKADENAKLLPMTIENGAFAPVAVSTDTSLTPLLVGKLGNNARHVLYIREDGDSEELVSVEDGKSFVLSSEGKKKIGYVSFSQTPGSIVFIERGELSSKVVVAQSVATSAKWVNSVLAESNSDMISPAIFAATVIWYAKAPGEKKFSLNLSTLNRASTLTANAIQSDSEFSPNGFPSIVALSSFESYILFIDSANGPALMKSVRLVQ